MRVPTAYAAIHDMLVMDVNEDGSAIVLSAKASPLTWQQGFQEIDGAGCILWSIDKLDLPSKQSMSPAMLLQVLASIQSSVRDTL